MRAIATSLETTVDALYAEAGFVPEPPEPPVEEESPLQQAIDAAAELTPAQRRALTEVYRAFVAANRVAPRS
jgi:hypothetical protein